MQSSALQQVSKYPLINLPDHFWREVQKANAALSRPGCPGNLTPSFHPQPWTAQFKAYPHLLLCAHCGDHLQSNSEVVNVANDPAIRLLQTRVGQRAKLVPVLRSRLSRGSYSCVHTHHQVAGELERRSDNNLSILSLPEDAALVTNVVRSSVGPWSLVAGTFLAPRFEAVHWK